MRLPLKTLAAALFATAIPLSAGPVAAAPLSQSLTPDNSDLATSEPVQYRRYYGDGYYAYGAVPGYRYYGPDRWGYYSPQAPAPGSSPRCTADREENSAFPSWMCR